MGKFKGEIKLSASDISKDVLEITGDSAVVGMILTLIDPALIVKPKMGNKAALIKMLKKPPKSVTIALGDSEISKAVLLSALKFAGVTK